MHPILYWDHPVKPDDDISWDNSPCFSTLLSQRKLQQHTASCSTIELLRITIKRTSCNIAYWQQKINMAYLRQERKYTDNKTKRRSFMEPTRIRLDTYGRKTPYPPCLFCNKDQKHNIVGGICQHCQATITVCYESQLEKFTAEQERTIIKQAGPICATKGGRITYLVCHRDSSLLKIDSLPDIDP